MAYEVPPLPYDYDALEPHVDEATMRLHHDKHHQAYVDKVNGALEGTEHADAPIADVLRNLEAIPQDKRTVVRNNGGGEPSGKLLSAIRETFRTVGIFKETMEAAAMSTFGSGWAWLVHDGTRVLIVTTTNQDSPISDGLTPLLGVDVWEHAYYLKYNNRRPDYIDAWWNVVNWPKVAEGLP